MYTRKKARIHFGVCVNIRGGPIGEIGPCLGRNDPLGVQDGLACRQEQQGEDALFHVEDVLWLHFQVDAARLIGVV